MKIGASVGLVTNITAYAWRSPSFGRVSHLEAELSVFIPTGIEPLHAIKRELEIVVEVES